MSGIVCNGARKTMLENVLNKTAPANLTLRLFKNNHTPVDADNVNASDYTEADFTGYAGLAFTAASSVFSQWASLSSFSVFAIHDFRTGKVQTRLEIFIHG